MWKRFVNQHSRLSSGCTGSSRSQCVALIFLCTYGVHYARMTPLRCTGALPAWTAPCVGVPPEVRKRTRTSVSSLEVAVDAAIRGVAPHYPAAHLLHKLHALPAAPAVCLQHQPT